MTTMGYIYIYIASNASCIIPKRAAGKSQGLRDRFLSLVSPRASQQKWFTGSPAGDAISCTVGGGGAESD